MGRARGRDSDESDVRALVCRLRVLHDLEGTVARLIACGEKAVEPLREFLLEGKPSCIYQPRQRVVELLAALGAKNVLMEYLRQPKDILDPVVRFGEEAVENTAARELAAWRTEDVCQLLLSLASKRRRSGVVEALGEFRRAESIPFFEKALEDDFCRPAAEEALRKLGMVARASLVRSVLSLFPDPDQENPSSLARRRSAISLLAEIGITQEDWVLLRPLLDHKDPHFLVPAAKLALVVGDREDRTKAARRLLQALPVADGALQGEIEACLFRCWRDPDPEVATEMTRLAKEAEEKPASGRVLRTLLRVRKRLERTS